MARVAIVTGGTRGIGEAISVALRDQGMKVAANYAGNDERAREFSERTGIPAFKWDVSDYDACQKGVAQVEAEVGPVDVLVNNAGITRDAHHEAHGPPEVAGGASTYEPRRLLQHGQGRLGRHDGPRIRPHRQHRLDQRTGRPVRPGQLCRRQVRHPRLHQGPCAGGCTRRRDRQRDRAGLYRHRHGRCRAAGGAAEDRRARSRSAGSAGRTRSRAASSFLVDENGGFITGSTLSINGGQHMY